MQSCASCGEQTEQRPCTACGANPLLAQRYALRQRLGQGHLRTTWRADGPGGAVAITITPHNLDPDLDQEVAALRQLSHPQLPRLLDDFTDRGRRCVAQAFIDGPDLLDELEAAPHTPQQVMAAVAEVAEILSFLHGHSPPIIHRALTPRHLVRRRHDGALVLIGLGSARDAIGCYMPPEQLDGDVWRASDVYALGAIAAHLLTQEPPGPAHRPDAPLRLRRPADLPYPVAALIDDMVHANPARRPTSVSVAQRARRLAEAAPSIPDPAPDDASIASMSSLYGLLWLFGVGALTGATIEVETIMGSGLFGAALGLIVGALAGKRGLRWGAACGLSAPAICAALFLWIVGAGISPGQAEGLVPSMLGVYLVLLAAGMLRAWKELAQQEAAQEAIAAPARAAATSRRWRAAETAR